RVLGRHRDSATEDLLFPQVLGRQFGDRITTIRNPPGGGDPIEQDAFIRGVRHEIRALWWETTFTLQAADRFRFWTIGHPDLGQVGTTNALAF
ncbi:MAG TPA: hypothetical protein VFT95_16785, partial [Micromonosporaceae bacterium]|nr:hypothetical protein [Micromonosporaceae bacterium]